MGDIVKKWHFRPLKEVVYSVYGEKRARQIEYKARKQRESLAGVSTTAPLNVQVRLRAYCMIWELKQKYYKADTPLPYVSKASHKADEDKIKSLEARIIKGGSDEPVGGRDHSKHIEELKRKYGGDEEHEYSDWDRELIAKIRQ